MNEDSFVVLTVLFKQEENERWTAECRELGTAAYGKSLQEARHQIEEAIELHLETLEAIGERGRFFKEHGIATFASAPQRDISVNMPVDSTVFVQPYVHHLAGAD
jgi:predicted RNase H-like HicB family nuclease